MPTVSSEVRDRSLTPPAPRITLSEHAVAFYQLPNFTQNETTILPLSKRRSRKTSHAYTNHFNPEVRNVHDTDVLDTTPEQHVMESVARDFVKQATGADTKGNAYWLRYVDGGVAGYHDPVAVASYVRMPNYAHDDINYMSQMSVLVHELAHSTANSGDTVTGFLTRNEAGYTTIDARSHLGMIATKLSKNEHQVTAQFNGEFFEEAFAEETAARWREQFSPMIAALSRGRWADGRGLKLPIRFFDYNYTSTNSTFAAVNRNSAYPAYALSLLSEKSGVDLYDLMCQARQPEHEAEAKRTFIRAINSIEPGLYQSLRKLQYTEEDFVKGLSEVQRIVSPPKTTTDE